MNTKIMCEPTHIFKYNVTEPYLHLHNRPITNTKIRFDIKSHITIESWKEVNTKDTIEQMIIQDNIYKYTEKFESHIVYQINIKYYNETFVEHIKREIEEAIKFSRVEMYTGEIKIYKDNEDTANQQLIDILKLHKEANDLLQQRLKMLEYIYK